MKAKLIRQKTAEADVTKLTEMVSYLKEVLEKPADFNDPEYTQSVKEILQFQADDGSFRLLDSYRVSSDARVDFCHVPTYMCAAILMKAFVSDPEALEGRIESALRKSLPACCKRDLKGHGYESLSGRVEAMGYFIRGGLKIFVASHRSLCPEFSNMIGVVMDDFRSHLENHEDESCSWGDCDIEEMERIVDAMAHKVFVYGTLLEGRYNYSRLLRPDRPAAQGYIEGFRMFDLGNYPGIIEDDGKVYGEVYQVDDDKLSELDWLEGEGELYVRQTVAMTTFSGKMMDVEVYVYNEDLSGCPELMPVDQPFCRDNVWYVSYGSNMLRARFRNYIEGGLCEFNGKEYPPCIANINMPIVSLPVDIPFDMYYGNYGMGSWKDSAVSFLDVSRPGHAFGRAYLIKKEQLAHIHALEGKGDVWYPDLIELEPIQGIRALTFTNNNTREKTSFEYVSEAYGTVLYEGLRETYPDATEKEISDYLETR